MTACFLDTGVLIALEASDDQYHQRASQFWRAFRDHPVPLVTTSYVLDEVVTFFNSRGHPANVSFPISETVYSSAASEVLDIVDLALSVRSKETGHSKGPVRSRETLLEGRDR